MGRIRPFLAIVSTGAVLTVAAVAATGCGLTGGDDSEQADGPTTTANFDPEAPCTLNPNTTTSISTTSSTGGEPSSSTTTTEPPLQPAALTVDRPAGFIDAVATNLPGGATGADARTVVITGDGSGLTTLDGDGAELASLTASEILSGDTADTRGRLVEVVWFNDAFRLFAFGHGGDADLMAPVYSSTDGVEWVEADVTVTAGAAATLGAQGLTVGPGDGRSGFTDAAVIGDRLVATGWASPDIDRIAAWWETTDGRRWTLTALPPVTRPGEYGIAFAADDMTSAVLIGNGDPTGAGILAATDTDTAATGNDTAPGNGGFAEIGPAITSGGGRSYTRDVAVVDGAVYLLQLGVSDGTTSLIRSADLATWSSIDLPEPAETGTGTGTGTGTEPVGEWRIAGRPNRGLVAWTDNRTAPNSGGGPARLWTLENDGTWTETPVEGTAIVDVDATVTASVDDRSLHIAFEPS